MVCIPLSRVGRCNTLTTVAQGVLTVFQTCLNVFAVGLIEPEDILKNVSNKQSCLKNQIERVHSAQCSGMGEFL